jgi:ribonuclease HI
MTKYIVYTDGGSRGNPGPAALGVYIEDGSKKEIVKIGKRIGETTNNVAEYSAITEAFSYLLANKEKLNIESVSFYMDSQLAYSQIVGLYKVKNERIRDFIFEIRQKEAELGAPVFYNHIRREFNKKADQMVNLALDNLI